MNHCAKLKVQVIRVECFIFYGLKKVSRSTIHLGEKFSNFSIYEVKEDYSKRRANNKPQ